MLKRKKAFKPIVQYVGNKLFVFKTVAQRNIKYQASLNDPCTCLFTPVFTRDTRAIKYGHTYQTMTISLYHFTPRASELQSNSGMIPLPGCGVSGLYINVQNVECVIDYYFHLLPELLNVL